MPAPCLHETDEIQGIDSDGWRQQVPRRLRDDYLAGTSLSERSAYPRDEDPEGAGLGTGWGVLPQVLKQSVGRDDPAHLEGQKDEQAPFLGAAEMNRARWPLDLKVSEDPDLNIHWPKVAL